MIKIKYAFALLLLVIVVSSRSVFSQEVKIIKKEELKAILNPKDDNLYVINFWATWCRPCIEEIPHFEKVAKDYKKQNVKFIFVAIEDKLKNVDTYVYLKKVKSEVVMLSDEVNLNEWTGMVNKKWGGEIPVTLFIKKDKRKFHSGEMSKDELIKNVKLYIK